MAVLSTFAIYQYLFFRGSRNTERTQRKVGKIDDSQLQWTLCQNQGFSIKCGTSMGFVVLH